MCTGQTDLRQSGCFGGVFGVALVLLSFLLLFHFCLFFLLLGVVFVCVCWCWDDVVFVVGMFGWTRIMIRSHFSYNFKYICSQCCGL